MRIMISSLESIVTPEGPYRNATGSAGHSAIMNLKGPNHERRRRPPSFERFLSSHQTTEKRQTIMPYARKKPPLSLAINNNNNSNSIITDLLTFSCGFLCASKRFRVRIHAFLRLTALCLIPFFSTTIPSIIMPRRPRSPSPSDLSLSSQASFASISSLSLTSTSVKKGSLRSYLFICAILWFSSLQVTLVTWNQTPFTVLPAGVLPGIGKGTLFAKKHKSSLGLIVLTKML